MSDSSENWGLIGGSVAALLAGWRWFIGMRRLQSDGNLANSINEHIDAMVRTLREELETSHQRLEDAMARQAAAQRERDEALRELGAFRSRVAELETKIENMREMLEYQTRLIDYLISSGPVASTGAVPKPPAWLYAGPGGLALARRDDPTQKTKDLNHA